MPSKNMHTWINVSATLLALGALSLFTAGGVFVSNNALTSSTTTATSSLRCVTLYETPVCADTQRSGSAAPVPAAMPAVPAVRTYVASFNLNVTLCDCAKFLVVASSLCSSAMGVWTQGRPDDVPWQCVASPTLKYEEGVLMLQVASALCALALLAGSTAVFCYCARETPEQRARRIGVVQRVVPQYRDTYF
jgi:hypothetical protein